MKKLDSKLISMRCACQLCLLLIIIFNAKGEVNYVALPEKKTCTSMQIFDTAGLVCSKCRDNYFAKPSNIKKDPYGNALECSCDSSKLKSEKECTQEEKRSGKCESYSCSSVCGDLSQAVSLDGRKCVSCGGPNNNETSLNYIHTKYDMNSRACTCSNPPKAEASGVPISTSKLIEIYDPQQALPTEHVCLPCPLGTAVIEDFVYENDDIFHSTAGISYEANSHVCARCPDPNMFFDTDYSCVCKEPFVKVGETSQGSQSCVQYLPTISTEFSKVKFYKIEIIRGTLLSSKTVVDSIAFSHHYIKSASKCEYFVDPKLDSFQACQTLGNLCVLSSYNMASAPCRQFQDIVAKTRDTNYHSQEDWKYSLPWLYYKDEADDIISDRGIHMKVSFSDVKEHTSHLKFKLAKYDLNGTFMGIEDLTSHFMYCQNSFTSLENVSRKKKYFAFGNSVRHKYSCSLNDLISTKMFFYDLYVVDEGNECSSVKQKNDCLYPVPVLNRNFVDNGSFPNINMGEKDEFNDRLVRRFFLFDNESGRSTTGIEVLRYAKTIVLEISIQSEDRNKIYPPKLTIEYAEVRPSLFENSDEIYEDLIWKVEYSMKTTNYWSSMKIVTGFASAIAFVIWIFRIITFQSRLYGTSLKDVDQEYSFTKPTVHSIMLAFHSFVWIFTPFSFFISAYWFIFFKLQAEVFLLMPSNNEFYGVQNEYYLFNSLYIALFVLQSTYIFYSIYRQCHNDIYFFDWERPKTNDQAVSAWRNILIARKWNKIQTKRKTNIEFTILCIVYILLGQGFDQNAKNSPNPVDAEGGYNNTILRFANTVWWWLLLASLQWLWNFLCYERYFVEPPSQYFLDLCTMANVSMLIMDEKYHGYYLHGRSPFEYADCSVVEMIGDLKKEEFGYLTERDLEAAGAPQNCQSIELYVTQEFVKSLKSIKEAIHSTFDLSGVSSTEKRNQDEKSNGSLSLIKFNRGMSDLVYFIQNFFDQSPPPSNDGLRREFREHTIIEKIIGTAIGVQKESKCILYPSEMNWSHDYGFISTTFLGMEEDLLLHDILTFNCLDILFDNTAISALFTYLMHVSRVVARDTWGKANVSKKTFLDPRFLG